MPVRVLPDFLVNQIAAGEVIERPASVVKELVENALDAGADQIIIDVVDGGRTLISVVDNGCGMTRDDLAKSVSRHATSKLPDDNLSNITYMGFRGEALPSIASVSNMTIDTFNVTEPHGWQLCVDDGDIRPSDWECGTRIRVENLFAKTPARLKFLHGDRAELMAVVDIVKRLAMSRMDVGFILNNKWRFPKNQDLSERVIAIMGDDVRGRMLDIDVSSSSSNMHLYGVISEPTLRRASSVDQYLFVNNRCVKDKVLVGALRAAYMDVMHAREFPLCALYLNLDSNAVDVNVSPAKTEVHFLEPSHVRSFIIKALRDRLAQTITDSKPVQFAPRVESAPVQNMFRTFHSDNRNWENKNINVCSPIKTTPDFFASVNNAPTPNQNVNSVDDVFSDFPLGHALAQIGNKYILATNGDNLIVVDQHAAHERITYEHLRNHAIKSQPLLTPIVVNLRAEDVMAVLSVADEIKQSGLTIEEFGDDAVAIFEKPSDWDLNWGAVLHDIADEVRANGHSSQLGERLHLKLANYACHHSVRAGQRLDVAQMNALLRDIENTERAGQCNHGRPVYKIIPFSEIDTWFERS
ncbi:MAG: DNA mismatch repair endonuclease MutL [Alphaproteobacteria bacterium]|nr:DNA mismatch repair endonuclease MutL [Alphaproteobacteria bacterium]